ncbi:hypothetical protein ABER98_01745 [Domibacillus aminovorans]|uniref:hypothetical protein n=1 Tax=Domibacillus aminovorans TaxID=29332 RepID=UPI003D1B5D1E
MTKIKFKTGVRYNGTRYAKGQIESGFSEKEVSLLVEENVAFVVGVPSVEDDKENIDSNDKSKLDTPPADTDNEQMFRELDENWNADELKIDAERLGIEFEKKISKKDLIQLIVEAGRADEFLSMLEDEEGE